MEEIAKIISNLEGQQLFCSSNLLLSDFDWYDSFVANATKAFNSFRRAAVRLKPWNGDLSQHRDRSMFLTYRGQKYTQNKAVATKPQTVLTYRGKQYQS